jgi:16S rRNA (cytidine1402-2'-O)-methyltransferase
MPSHPHGKLILAANSLGRPEDIPLRSLENIRQADVVVFEEPRVARQTLKAAGIQRDFLKFSEHEESAPLGEIETALRQGKTVVYMSDQGMPVLADPGRTLLNLAQQLRSTIEVIPGPSSVTAALAACSFYEGSFFYQGFLGREPQHRLKELAALRQFNVPVVILETPYRRQALCEAVAEVYPADRKVLLAIDITGEHEQYVSTHCRTLVNQSAAIAGKLNFVMIIAGR